MFRRTGKDTALHRRTISKIVALCLVVLGVLPFSAPFKTFDFADTQSEGLPGSLPKDKVDSDQDVVSAPGESLDQPPLTAVAVSRFVRPTHVEDHLHASMVLRL